MASSKAKLPDKSISHWFKLFEFVLTVENIHGTNNINGEYVALTKNRSIARNHKSFLPKLCCNNIFKSYFLIY